MWYIIACSITQIVFSVIYLSFTGRFSHKKLKVWRQQGRQPSVAHGLDRDRLVPAQDVTTKQLSPSPCHHPWWSLPAACHERSWGVLHDETGPSDEGLKLHFFSHGGWGDVCWVFLTPVLWIHQIGPVLVRIVAKL